MANKDEDLIEIQVDSELLDQVKALIAHWVCRRKNWLSGSWSTVRILRPKARLWPIYSAGRAK